MRFSFLVGTHRSGTTWLGNLLSETPNTRYWPEPRQVWSYGHYKRLDDVLRREDATNAITKHIRSRFTRYAEANGCHHFLEKTPSNCLRVDFMNAIFPQGKFILLLRDGRAVLRSTDEIQNAGAGWARMVQRLRESSLKEMPAYLDRLPWIWRKVSNKKLDFWGVRPPGWREWAESLTPMQVIAKQWSESILAAKASFDKLPAHRKLVLRYEDLVADPASQIEIILNFLEIDGAQTVITRATESCRVESVPKWRTELSDELLDEVRHIIEPTLLELDYGW